MAELACLTSTAISCFTPEEWVLEISRPLPHISHPITPEQAAFWPTRSWPDTPWIVDHRGDTLTARKYAKIRPCPVAELQIHRIGVRTYAFVITTIGTTRHQQVKLRRCGLAILLSAPGLEIGGAL